MAKAKLTYSALFSYGLLALPLAFAGLPLYMYAPKFYAESYGLSLSAMGGILLILRAVDALQDPVLGLAADKFSKYKFSLFCLSAALLAAGIYFLFHPVDTPGLIWFGLCMFIAATGFSLMSVLLGSIGIIWTKDYNDKTRIAAFREGFILIGVLVAVTLPSIINAVTPKFEALSLYARITVLLTAFISVVFFFWKKYFFHSYSAPKHEFKLFQFFKKQNYRIFFTTYFFNSCAAAFPIVTFLFYVDSYLGLEKWSGLFLAVYFLAGVTAMPLWHAYAKKYGKLQAWKISMIIAILSFSWVLVLSPGNFYGFLGVCCVSGLALGADFALPSSILSDIMDDSKSENLSATQFSVQNFISKSALAIASLCAFIGLDQTGYEAVETTQTIGGDGIKHLYAIPSIALKLIALLCLLRWQKKNGEQDVFFQKTRSNNGGRHVV